MSLNLSSARWSRCEWWAFIYGTVDRGQQSSLTKREQTNEKKKNTLKAAVHCSVTYAAITPGNRPLYEPFHHKQYMYIFRRRSQRWKLFVGQFGDCHQPLCHNRVLQLQRAACFKISKTYQ